MKVAINTIAEKIIRPQRERNEYNLHLSGHTEGVNPLELLILPPTLEKLKDALKKLRNNRAPNMVGMFAKIRKGRCMGTLSESPNGQL